MKQEEEFLPPLFELASPFLYHYGKIRLLEPLESSGSELREKLVNGTYKKPYIFEDQFERSLHFDPKYVQSSMSKSKPDDLVARYTQKMMGGLFFCPEPGNFFTLGLGGGSLQKFLYNNFPDCTIKTVESSPDVVALSPYFLVPENQEAFQIHVGDGAALIHNENHASIDIMMIDAFDGDGIATSLSGHEFVSCAFDKLSLTGVMIVNLGGEKSRIRKFVRHAESVFAGRITAVELSDSENYVLFCFKDRKFNLNAKMLESQATVLAARYKLDFSFFLKQMRFYAKNRLAARLKDIS